MLSIVRLAFQFGAVQLLSMTEKIIVSSLVPSEGTIYPL